MKTATLLVAILALTACGVETAGTAATAAALKKQEIEQGKKTLEQFQQKLDQANQATQQRAEQAAGEK
ncbi:MAG: hypothetical protein H6R15_1157 [Proteobacteria bacterium]|nr:hypothetical protein [Pseudomonadota bacterium]